MQLIDKKELETGRITGILPVQGGPSLPVWMVCGVSDGPTLVLTAGVHGCEYVEIGGSLPNCPRLRSGDG